MNSRIPPLLEPYLALPPEASLILLTSVLGASTNWLILRHLYSALATPTVSASVGADTDISRESGGLQRGDQVGSKGKYDDRDRDGSETAVVLVSFLRDLTFWQEGGRRLGLDLAKLTARKRFIFVDGLSGLFLPGVKVGAVSGLTEDVILQSAELGRVYEDILGVVRSLQKKQDEKRGSRKVLLIVDALDLLLATAGPEASAVKLGDMVMDLREHVYATILALSNDSPLVLRQHTPLEINHAAFLLSVAHQAYLTMSLRMLDTGTARDVSGVIRVGGGNAEATNGNKQLEVKDLLYFVGGDGSVRVFERGQ